jgi:alanyl-tRNA synthetase
VANTEKAELAIINTLKFSGVYIHEAGLISGELKVGDRISLLVDKVVRENTRRNHSATHLLHAALRSVVGKHALQKGSFVNGERLRFDFQNKTGVTEEELTKIEELVNHWIMQGSPNITQEMDYSKAVEAGALALFGESYSEKVRVVKFGDSVELCGGTHAYNTSEIGIFSILSESSVAKGVRRIEAVTGLSALKVIQEKNRILKETARLLGTGIEQVVSRVSELKKKSQQKSEPVSISSKDIKFLSKIEKTTNEAKILVGRVDIEAEMLKSLGDDILGKRFKYKIKGGRSFKRNPTFSAWKRRRSSTFCSGWKSKYPGHF